MQAHFNPNAAADSCAVLAESWANGVVEMWFVVCATAPLLVEHPRPQTQPQMGWGFLCHCSWIRLWPRSFGFWQFRQPFRKSEPLEVVCVKHLHAPWSGNVMLPHSTHSWLLSVVPETNSAKVVDKRLHCSESNCCIAHPGVPVGRNVWPCLFLDMKGLSVFQTFRLIAIARHVTICIHLCFFLVWPCLAYVEEALGCCHMSLQCKPSSTRMHPNAAFDSYAVRQSRLRCGLWYVWYVLRRLCWLNIQDPKHNHRWVEAFYVIVLESDSGLEASDSDNLGSLFAKVSPWRLFAPSICTRLEVATWCCRTQHIADCQAQSQEQIVPKKGPTVEGCDAQIEGFRSFSSQSRSFSFSVPEVSDELVSIWKHRKAEPLWKEALYMSKWCRWRVFENVSGSLKGDGADADSDIAWSKEV